MKRRLLVLLTTLLVLAAALRASPLPAEPSPSGKEETIYLPVFTNPSTDTLVATIYIPPSFLQDLEVSSDQGTRLTHSRFVLILFKSGLLIWSENKTLGGPPYKSTRIPAARVEALISSLATRGEFDAPSTFYRFNAVERPSTTIYVAGRPRPVYMESFHELFEHNTHLVVLSNHPVDFEGARKGMTREQVLASDPSVEYRAFRRAWTRIKNELLGLIPKGRGVPADEYATAPRLERMKVFIPDSRSTESPAP